MKNKTVAGILAIIFGEWGIHCFYLGRIGRGLVYLLIWSFFCWTIIVPVILAIIASIEGIVLLCSSQENFDGKYNKGFYNNVPQQPQQVTLIAGQPQPAQNDQAKKSKIETLMELKELLDRGVLTKEEFEVEKQKILRS